MFSGVKNTLRFLVVPAVFAVLFFVTSGFVLGLETNSPTANCPFSGHSMSICKMNPLGHIQEWQSTFTTIPARDVLALFSILLALFALLKSPQVFPVSKISREPDLYIHPFHIHTLPILNPLKEAFSRGILNPKIF